MIDSWLEAPCGPPEISVYCPACDEEHFTDAYIQIECDKCETCFYPPLNEVEFDYQDYACN